MSESPGDEASEEVRAQEGPGRRLRKARESRGLSREEAADELRLDLRHVRALEEDDYENLPPPAFVIGYLRNYARLLELPEQEIIESFEKAGTEQPPELVSYTRDTQVRSSDLPVRLVTYLLVIGLAVLLAAWWLSEGQENGGPDVSEPAETEMAPEPELVPTPVPGETLETPVEPEQPSAVDEPEAGMPAEPAGDQPAQAPDIPVQQAPPEQPVPPVSAQPGTELRLVFTADSWAEVTDATGRRLVYDLVKDGGEMTLEGQAPFRIFLGYAPGVTLYYGGEKFDHTAYIRRNETARFRVGSSEDNSSGTGTR